MEETGESFIPAIHGMLTEIENSRREAAAHREARAVAAVAEGELHALRSELAFVRAEGLLLEIAAVFGSIDDLDTLPARVREAAARRSS